MIATCDCYVLDYRRWAWLFLIDIYAWSGIVFDADAGAVWLCIVIDMFLIADAGAARLCIVIDIWRVVKIVA
jgi:hypothetical protein